MISIRQFSAKQDEKRRLRSQKFAVQVGIRNYEAERKAAEIVSAVQKVREGGGMPNLIFVHPEWRHLFSGTQFFFDFLCPKNMGYVVSSQDLKKWKEISP